MRARIAIVVLLGAHALPALAQNPSSAFDRGQSLQSWQDPGSAELLASCRMPPEPFRIGGGAAADDAPAPPPPPPALPTVDGIPGVVAPGQTWRVVWAWEGNNADGIIADGEDAMLFADNDASNVMRLDPSTGLATIVHDDANTGGAVSRSKNGALFLASRGLNATIEQLEPVRRVLADSFRGEPLDCIGGVINDLAADARGGVYVTISGAGLYYADPNGVVSEQGENIPQTNGIVLSADERTLYVTNGPQIVAFDVQADGSLTNQREFGRLQGGQGGDGSAIDAEGRLYVATGSTVDVFAPSGEFLGSIAGPVGLHGVAFGGPDKRTLFGIVFYGGWGTSSARNQVVALPMLAQGYTGRAK